MMNFLRLSKFYRIIIITIYCFLNKIEFQNISSCFDYVKYIYISSMKKVLKNLFKIVNFHFIEEKIKKRNKMFELTIKNLRSILILMNYMMNQLI
jgi:hypothetical protein